MTSDYLIRALAYLRDHPDSSAKTIANGIGCNHQDRFIFQLLDGAAYKGACQRWRRGNGGPWLWEACEPPADGMPACYAQDKSTPYVCSLADDHDYPEHVARAGDLIVARWPR